MACYDKLEVRSGLHSVLHLLHGLVGHAQPARIDALVNSAAVARRVRHLREVEVGSDVLQVDGSREGQDHFLVAIVAEQGLLRLSRVVLRKRHDCGTLWRFLARRGAICAGVLRHVQDGIEAGLVNFERAHAGMSA